MKRRLLTAIFLIVLIAGSWAAWQVFGPTVSAPEKKYFFIRTGSAFEEVRQSLIEQQVIKNTYVFDLLAKQLKYTQRVKAGRYLVKDGSSLIGLIRMLRSGNQAPVNLVINKIRVKEELAKKIAASFETDSATVMQVLNDTEVLQEYGVNPDRLLTLVIPNTYSFYWNYPTKKILDKLYAERNKFWNEERTAKAASLNLTPDQVYIMASIIEEETNKTADKSKIASVYLNRMKTGMKLQADPTVKFAMQDFGLKRILFKHLTYPSPYNTYVNTGLPPGPICTPSAETIDAVLNAPETNYLYFVAKPDFNGYSNFASNYAEHMVYARAYQRALDSLVRARASQ